MSTTDFSSDLNAARQHLLDRLTAFRRRVRRVLILEGAAWMVSLIVGAAFLTLALDWWFEFHLATRAIIILLIVAGFFEFIRRRIVRIWSSPMGPLELMASLDESRLQHDRSIDEASAAPIMKWTNLAPKVASALQLPDQISAQQSVSPTLIQRALQQCHALLDQVDFSVFLNRRHQRRLLIVLSCVVVLPIALSALSPTTFSIWFERWLLASNRPWPRTTLLELLGEKEGRLIVPRGESSLLQLAVVDSDPDRLTEFVTMRIEHADHQPVENVSFTRYGDGDFRFELPPLSSPATVTLRGGDARLGPITIDPVDRPRLTSLTLTGKLPQRDKPIEFNFSGAEGTVQLLPSAEAELALVAGEPLSDVKLELLSGKIGSLERRDKTHFASTWTHHESVQMRVTLVSAVTGLSSFPRPVAIGVQPDRPPHLTFKQTGVKLRVTPTAILPWVLSARDDFGIQSADLHVKITRLPTTEVQEQSPSATEDKPAPSADEASESSADEANETTGAETSAPSTDDSPTPSAVDRAKDDAVNTDDAGDAAEIKEETMTPSPAANVEQSVRSLYGPVLPTEESGLELSDQVELEPLKLTPGCTVELVVDAKDDCVTGAQTTRSRTLVFRIVTAEELFREILLKQQQLRARLRKATDEAENMRDEIPLGQYPEQSSEFLRKHRVIQREVSMVHQGLAETVTEMELNQLGGPEAHQLIRQMVLDPLGDLHDRTLTQQRQAWEELNDGSAEKVESLLNRQDQIVADLDKILKNMAQWDSFIDVINQLNSVIKLETQIRTHTEDLRQKQIESVFEEEE
ncbi:MAG: hypothetical protein WEB58_10740 [Planctomycetaceae bacterium]